MKKLILIGLSLFGFVSVVRCASQLPIAKATIKTVDDDEKPMDGVRVGTTFEVPPYSENGVRMYGERQSGLTENGGSFSAENSCLGFLHYSAKKEGYYEVLGVRYDYTGLNALKTHWLPENPELTVVMKKIINPVPMYVRKVSAQIPEVGKEIGFDLEAGDWVAPFGRGSRSDFLFYATCCWVDYYDFNYEITMKFNNIDEGIQIIEKALGSNSVLKSPQFAPEMGYINKWSREGQRGSNLVSKGLEMQNSEYKDYMFRVRVAHDKNGKIIAANYGKIVGGIRTSHGEGKPDFVFTYYYNPDSKSRSLEFDSKQNLAKEERYSFPP